MDESTAIDALRGASLRVTRQRIAVLAAIDESPHADVGVIVDLVRDKIGDVSTQTVYGVLNTLVDVHLARRIDLPNSGARYEGQTRDAHQHIVCRGCGQIADVEEPHATGRALPESHGFRIDDVEVTYWGACPACQHAVPEPSPVVQ